MNESLKIFMQKIFDDPEVAAKLSACKNDDEAYAIASAMQGGFTKEEFVEAINDVIAKGKAGELSDDDLVRISGGFDVDWEALGNAAWKSAVFGAAGGGAAAAALAAGSI